jgi:hypothetical protein
MDLEKFNIYTLKGKEILARGKEKIGTYDSKKIKYMSTILIYQMILNVCR